jgi:hypothetical protein
MQDVTLSHAPTIGEMYEGLARTILSYAIPEEFGLRWVSGFVRAQDGRLSRQVDCMLVQGEAEEIPHTEKEICALNDVVAVVEIKKNLRSGELIDAWQNLGSITALYRGDDDDAQDGRVSVEPLLRAFSNITGKVFRPRGSDPDELTLLDRLIAHCLHFELSCPVRVAFGFEGFKTEKGLRNSFYECLGRLPAMAGIPYLPNIISSGNFSLCKLTAFPYSSRIEDGWWGVVGSTSANPLALLIEHIFYRLSLSRNTRQYLGLDLETEVFSRVLTAKFRREGARAGWEYKFADVAEKHLRARCDAGTWEPVEIDQPTAVFIQLLAKYRSAELSDAFLVETAKEMGITPAEFARRLVDARLVLWDGPRLVPAVANCAVVIQPDGKFVAGDADDHRLRNWLAYRK